MNKTSDTFDDPTYCSVLDRASDIIGSYIISIISFIGICIKTAGLWSSTHKKISITHKIAFF